MVDVAHQRVDYDQIADRYDHERLRGRDVDPDLLAYLAERRDGQTGAVAVLDVGCGTGSQLVADRACLPRLRLVGLDLFRGMLSQARYKSVDVHWVQADGARLPFADASFDYVTNQFSFHHVRDKGSMIAEVYRVLRPGGRFVMTNICPRQMPGWAMYRYFPAAWARDVGDFLPREEIRQLLVQSGFDQVTASSRRSAFEEDLCAFAQVVRARTTSQLVALSERAYRAGLRQVEGELRRARGRAVAVKTESCILKITGEKT